MQGRDEKMVSGDGMNPRLRSNFTAAEWLSEIEDMSFEVSRRYIQEGKGSAPGTEPTAATVDQFYARMAKHYRRKFNAPKGVSVKATVAALKRGSVRALQPTEGWD